MAEPYTLLHEVSVYIYILILILQPNVLIWIVIPLHHLLLLVIQITIPNVIIIQCTKCTLILHPCTVPPVLGPLSPISPSHIIFTPISIQPAQAFDPLPANLNSPSTSDLSPSTS